MIASGLVGVLVLAGVAVALLARPSVLAHRSNAPAVVGVVVADGGAPVDAVPGGDATWIACGDARCKLPGEACCVYPFPVDRDPAPPASFVCVTAGRCPAPVIGPHGGSGPPSALSCASTSNCTHGDVCCIRVRGLVVWSSCVDEEQCENESEAEEQARERRDPDADGMHAQLCDPRAGARSGCPAKAPCTTKGAVQWQLPPRYGTCGVADEGPY